MSLILNPAPEEDQEARIQRQLDRGPYTSPVDVINHALDLLEQSDDWLLRNKDAINTALDQSFASFDRGAGYTPEESQALLDQNRAARA